MLPASIDQMLVEQLWASKKAEQQILQQDAVQAFSEVYQTAAGALKQRVQVVRAHLGASASTAVIVGRCCFLEVVWTVCFSLDFDWHVVHQEEVSAQEEPPFPCQ